MVDSKDRNLCEAPLAEIREGNSASSPSLPGEGLGRTDTLFVAGVS